jgi:hypothetical protein
MAGREISTGRFCHPETVSTRIVADMATRRNPVDSRTAIPAKKFTLMNRALNFRNLLEFDRVKYRQENS